MQSFHTQDDHRTFSVMLSAARRCTSAEWNSSESATTCSAAMYRNCNQIDVQLQGVPTTAPEDAVRRQAGTGECLWRYVC